MTDPTDRASDDFGCPAVADVRLKGGLTLLTRCRRRSGHPGQHNDKKVRRWLDSETVWLVRPTSGALENVTSTGDDE